MEEILVYQDRDVTVVNKPAGMLSEPDGRHPDVLTTLQGDSGQEYYPVHRLDKDTTGLMVVANHKKAAAALSQAVAENRLEKEYLAVVSGCPSPAEGTMTDLLYRDARKNRSFVVTRPRKGVREARLTYQQLALSTWEDSIPISLVRVKLDTGRTHQIRVQFASRQMPLLGDGHYGSRIRDCKTALHSFRLTFPHPRSGELMTFDSLPDREAEPWKRFSYPEED